MIFIIYFLTESVINIVTFMVFWNMNLRVSITYLQLTMLCHVSLTFHAPSTSLAFNGYFIVANIFVWWNATEPEWLQGWIFHIWLVDVIMNDGIRKITFSMDKDKLVHDIPGIFMKKRRLSIRIFYWLCLLKKALVLDAKSRGGSLSFNEV